MPQPTAAELAAAAARREKAEQQRALSRLPGLVRRLQTVEKAVLLNLRHAELARYHCVRYCCPKRQQSGNAGSIGSADQATAPLLPPERQHRSSDGHPAGPPAPESLAEAEAEAMAVLPPGAAAAAAPATEAARSSESASLGTPFSGSPSPILTSQQPRQPELQLLWSWQSELSEELPVSCLAFNKVKPSLLAVGYGRLDYAVSGAGLIAVWSLANPTHPLWHATTPCGVSALDWSGRSAGTLAVGFFDGSLALYNVRHAGNSGGSSGLASSSSASSGAARSGSGGPKPLARAPPAGAAGSGGSGHSEPVWRLRFVPKAADPADEMLLSVSSDGNLLEWKHAQGLESTELLRLKRQQAAAAAPRLTGAARVMQVCSADTFTKVQQA